MVMNDTYLGVVTLGERRLEGAREALVPLSLWKAAQSTVTVKRTGKNAAGVAGGLLVCGNCKRPLSVTGTDNPSYTCRRTISKHPCDAPVYVSKKHADRWVEEQIRGKLAGLCRAPLVRTGLVSGAKRDVDQSQLELENFMIHARAADGEAFALGLRARQERLDAAREALRAATVNSEEAREVPTVETWDSLGLHEKRRAAKMLVDRVEVAGARETADEISRYEGHQSRPEVVTRRSAGGSTSSGAGTTAWTPTSRSNASSKEKGQAELLLFRPLYADSPSAWTSFIASFPFPGILPSGSIKNAARARYTTPIANPAAVSCPCRCLVGSSNAAIAYNSPAASTAPHGRPRPDPSLPTSARGRDAAPVDPTWCGDTGAPTRRPATEREGTLLESERQEQYDPDLRGDDKEVVWVGLRGGRECDESCCHAADRNETKKDPSVFENLVHAADPLKLYGRLG